MKVSVYVDGFNLYYAALRGTPHKWLDLRALFQSSLPEHYVHRIKYFTARVEARPHDPDQPVRQDAYLRALLTIPRLTIHFGTFRTRTKSIRVAPSEPLAGRRINGLVTEEKGSDVNLATELLTDGFRRDYDGAVVVSDDSDLLGPIRAVRSVLQLPVAILNPHPSIDPGTGKPRRRRELQRAVTAGPQETRWFYSHLDRSLLTTCLLPNPTIDRNGRQIHKPEKW